jgi:TetR/AcrR family tetracycline transcriptional repressor
MEISKKQQQIAEAALQLLKKKGLEGLSLRELSKSLHIQAPALYWHFKNKEMLVDYMAEAILQKEFKNLQTEQSKGSWQDWIITTMTRLRHAMLAYPDGARVVAGARLLPAVTIATIFERSLIALMSDGVDQQTALHVIITATHYTFGFVIEEQSSPARKELSSTRLKTFIKSYPNLVKAAGKDWKKGNPDKDFLIGLQYIIKGSEANSH